MEARRLPRDIEAKPRNSQYAKEEFKASMKLYQEVLRQEPSNSFHYNTTEHSYFSTKQAMHSEVDQAIGLDSRVKPVSPALED